MRVIGIDPSLSGTALALPDGRTLRIDPKTRRGPERLKFIRDQVLGHVWPGMLVVIEDYSYASAYQAHQIGELGGVLRLAFYERDDVTVLQVAPHARAKWATGKGTTSKDAVVSAVSAALGLAFENNDEVDAFILRDIGLAYLGEPSAFGPLPKYREEVLEALRNPKPKKGKKKVAA